MAKSDLDALLERARNPVAACPVTAALDKLPDADRRKFHDALLARSSDNVHWAFIGTELGRILTDLTGSAPLDRRAVENYRRRHG